MKNVFKKIDGVKTGLFAAGVLFGTAGIKVLASDDAKKCVMKTTTNIQENAGDIYAEAKAINEEREAAAEAVDDMDEFVESDMKEETEE